MTDSEKCALLATLVRASVFASQTKDGDPNEGVVMQFLAKSINDVLKCMLYRDPTDAEIALVFSGTD